MLFGLKAITYSHDSFISIIKIIIIIVNTLLIFIKPLANLCLNLRIASLTLELGVLDIVAIAIIVLLLIIYLGKFYFDARYYSKIDPKKDTKND